MNAATVCVPGPVQAGISDLGARGRRTAGISGGVHPRIAERAWAGVPAVRCEAGRARLCLAPYSAASDAHRISRSFRAKTHLFANAGCDQTTRRRGSGLVGSIRCVRLISR